MSGRGQPGSRRPLKIAVDAACLANGRGYGRFTGELLREMVLLAPEHDYVLFADRRAAERLSVPGARVVVVEQGASPTLAASAEGNRSPRDMLRFSAAVWRERADVFFSPSVYSFFPLPPGLPAVITFHDAIAERFPELTFATPRARIFWQLKTRLALAQARLVLTVSDFSASELVTVLGVSRCRIRVAVEAPAQIYRPSESATDVARAAAAAGVPSNAAWFVYVGGFNPHKNLELIVRAHAAVAAGRATPPHLVLVGTLADDVFHGTRAAVCAEIARLGTGALVHWPGFVEDEELRHLLSGAVALLLPSQNEGFGLPAVEAAACGTPVIATTASPLPELLAGGGIFVAPRDQGGVESAMCLLLDDSAVRGTMGARARAGAGRLSWRATAGATLDALHEAVA